MQQPTRDIEVEVVEIDGVPVTPRTQTQDPAPHRATNDWRRHIHRLPRLWWPLWVLIGIVALALALTVGLAAGILFLCYRTIQHLVAWISGKSAH